MLIISKGKGSTKKWNPRKMSPSQRAESIYDRNKGNDPKEMERIQSELKQEEYKEKYSG